MEELDARARDLLPVPLGAGLDTLLSGLRRLGSLNRSVGVRVAGEVRRTGSSRAWRL